MQSSLFSILTVPTCRGKGDYKLSSDISTGPVGKWEHYKFTGHCGVTGPGLKWIKNITNWQTFWFAQTLHADFSHVCDMVPTSISPTTMYSCSNLPSLIVNKANFNFSTKFHQRVINFRSINYLRASMCGVFTIFKDLVLLMFALFVSVQL